MPKRQVFVLSMLVLSVAGLLLSYALAEEFYYYDLPQYDGHRAGIFTTISSQVCGEADSFYSCESVAASRFAVLFGFPVALYGIMLYLITFFMALACMSRRETVQKSMTITLFWTTAWAVVADIGLFLISYVKIRSLCPLCLFTYAVTFLLLGVTLFRLIKLRQNPMRPLASFKTGDGLLNKRSLAANIGLAGLIIVAGGGLSYAASRGLIQGRIDYTNTHKEIEIQKIVTEFAARQPEPLRLPVLSVHDNAKRPVTIVEISDFLCPYCARTALLLNEIIEENPDRIDVLFVNFPLDKACNPLMRVDMHRGACELAKGAICAAAQGKLHPYQNVAFSARKNGPTREDVIQIATEAGLDVAALDQCMEDPSTLDTLQWQIQAAEAQGVHATPTIYINGKRYKGHLYKEALQQIIDLEAKRVAEESSKPKENG